MLAENRITITPLEKCILIELPNIANFLPIEQYITQIAALYQNKHYPEIIINIEKKKTLSSVGYGFIMSIAKLCPEKSVQLKLICREEKVLQMIELLKIGKLFRIYNSVQEALQD